MNNPADPKYIPKKPDCIDELKLLSMDLNEMELQGVKLPEKETFLGDLTPQQIVEKINKFHNRLNNEAHLKVAPLAESYFLNLIALYPVSMCNKNLSETLKLVIALFYFGSQLTEAEKQKRNSNDIECKELFPSIIQNSISDGYSQDDLALIFERPKPTIAEAIRQKKKIVTIMLEEATLRNDSKKETLKQLIEENSTNQKNEM